MKHRYAKVSRKLVIFFCLFSVLVVLSNILGITRFGYISPINFLIVLSSLFGSLLTSIYIITGYKDFNLKNHRKLVKNLKNKPIQTLPSIDIFLPSAGEDIKTLNRTFERVFKLNYPKHKVKTYVLDDKEDENVKKLSNKYGFKWLSRPNKGVFKKAGNLQFGFDNSKGKYILILDADFAPKKDMLFELLPYLENDDKVAIALSPQDFVLNRREPLYIQKGDIGIQEFFYRICQVARNTYNATICTGTNGLYRREALNKAGGFYQIEHSEDSHTGLNLIKNGYKVSYLPIILAVGYCPSDYFKLYKQRSRWCQGSLTLGRSPLFREAKLSPMAIWCYLSGFYYYLNSFVILALPIHTLHLLATPQKSSLVDMLFFVPNVLYLIFSFTIFYYPRFSFSVLGNQFFFYWTYLFVILKLFVFGKNESWTPTGAVKHKNFSYTLLLSLIFTYIFCYWLMLTLIFLSDSFVLRQGDSLLLFWILFNFITHISFIYGFFAISNNRISFLTEITESLSNRIKLIMTLTKSIPVTLRYKN